MSVMVLAISRVSDGGMTRHEKITSLPVVVGRSPACDVIIDDVYIAARQYSLCAAADGGGFEICAFESVNPTRVNDAVLPAGQWLAVASGAVIAAGESHVAVFAPDHVVAAAHPLPQQTGAWSAFARMSVAACLLLAAAVMTAGWSYIEMWSKEAAMTAAMSVAAVFVSIIVWAALWAVVGRLLTHRSRFAVQISLASLYVMASLLAGVVQRGFDFLLSGNIVAQVMSVATQTVLLAVLTMGCLAAATTLTPRKRVQAALSFSVGLMISVISLGVISNMGFDPMPPFESTLSPGLWRFAPAVPVDAFMADSAVLFDDSFAVPDVVPQAEVATP